MATTFLIKRAGSLCTRRATCSSPLSPRDAGAGGMELQGFQRGFRSSHHATSASEDDVRFHLSAPSAETQLTPTFSSSVEERNYKKGCNDVVEPLCFDAVKWRRRMPSSVCCVTGNSTPPFLISPRVVHLTAKSPRASSAQVTSRPSRRSSWAVINSSRANRHPPSTAMSATASTKPLFSAGRCKLNPTA